MKIEPNTTIIDVALNLSGSLAGIPAVLEQLPAGPRIGLRELPELWDEITTVGQSWTPNLEGLDVTLDVPVYNVEAVRKAPYSTNLFSLQKVIEFGNFAMRALVEFLP